MQEFYTAKDKKELNLIVNFLYNLYKDAIDNGMGNILYTKNTVTLTVLDCYISDNEEYKAEEKTIYPNRYQAVKAKKINPHYNDLDVVAKMQNGYIIMSPTEYKIFCKQK